MALILEVVDTRTGDVRTRIRLGGQMVTIGRDYTNDLILDDPYVDARHARIFPNENGAPVIEDLGSANRIVLDEETTLTGFALEAGMSVRLGRTTLRVRDVNAPVPPALPDRTDPRGATSARTLAWITSREGRIGLPLLALALSAFQSWIGTHDRSSSGTVFGLVLAMAIAMVLYVSIWAIATRIIRHRFSFFEHMALASAAYVASSVVSVVFNWLDFAFPDGLVIGWTELAILWGLFATAIALHLGFASHLPRVRRWEAGIVTSVVLAGITGLAALAIDEGFSSGIPFASSVKPVPVGLLSTSTVAEFADAAVELQEKVDSLAVEKK